jgi:MFS family permease
MCVAVIVNAIENIECMLIGRFFFGLATGIFTVAGPKMVEETVPANLIGTFGIITNLSICFGVMVAILMGAAL